MSSRGPLGADEAADLNLARGDETNGPLRVKEVIGSVLLRKIAADRVSTRSGDSLLRCVRPDDDAFSTHAKFCRDVITWDIPFLSPVTINVLDSKASHAALSALGCPSLVSHAFECARVFPRCTSLPSSSPEYAGLNVSLFVLSHLCVADCLDMKRLCSPFAEAYITGVDCYGTEFDPDFRTCFALSNDLKAPCSLFRTVGREAIILTSIFMMNMVFVCMKYLLQRAAQARARRSLILVDKHPLTRRHVRSSSRISLLSSVLEDDDGPPQPTPRKHFSETEAIVNRGLGENDDFAQNYAGLDVAGGVNVRGRRECRICKLGEDDSQALGALIEPCGCSGSMRFLHTRCLQRWLELKRNSTGLTCEVCGCSYKITMNRRCHLQPKAACTVPSILAILRLMIALTLAPIIPVINWLVCEGRSQRQGTRGEGLLVLFSEVLMVGIYYYMLSKFSMKIWQSNSSIEIAGSSLPPFPQESLDIEMLPISRSNGSNKSSSSALAQV